MTVVATALVLAFLAWSAWEDMQRGMGQTLVDELEQFLAEVLAA